MTNRSTAAVGMILAAALISPAAAQAAPAAQAAAAAAKGPNISKEAFKALSELQTAVNANNVALIPAKVAAAQAAVKTPDDRYILAQLQLKAASAAKDNAAIESALQAMIASGAAPQSKQLPIYTNLANIQYGAKQYDAAGASLDRVVALDPTNAEALTLLAETRNKQGRTSDAVTTLQRALQLRSAGGQKAPEDWYKRAVGLAYDAKSMAAVDFSRQWVAAYPTTANWRDALRVYRNLANPQPQALLDTLRLARATGALEGDQDFHIYAYTASDLHGAGEAKAVIAEGEAAHQIDPTKPLFKEIAASFNGRLIPNDATLAAGAKAAMASSDGKLALAAGEAYYGHGDFAQAAALDRAALGKSGADTNLANLHLGMALARSGDKAGAAAALGAVTGPNADIAKYWLAYVAAKA